jgi:hypothetical protein
MQTKQALIVSAVGGRVAMAQMALHVQPAPTPKYDAYQATSEWLVLRPPGGPRARRSSRSMSRGLGRFGYARAAVERASSLAQARSASGLL